MQKTKEMTMVVNEGWLDPDENSGPRSGDSPLLPNLQQDADKRNFLQPRGFKRARSSGVPAAYRKSEDMWRSLRESLAEDLKLVQPCIREITNEEAALRRAFDNARRHQEGIPFDIYMTSDSGAEHINRSKKNLSELEREKLSGGTGTIEYPALGEFVSHLLHCIREDLSLDRDKALDHTKNSQLWRYPSGATLYQVGVSTVKDYNHFKELCQDGDPAAVRVVTFRKIVPPPEHKT